MGPDYESRLRLRRAGGVAGPLVLLPLAAWFYVVTPSSDLAGAPAAQTAAADPAPVVTAAGVVVRASVLPDGGYDVVETVRLGEPATTLALAPPDLGRGGATFADVRATYADVEVRAQGLGVVALPGVDGPVTVPLAGPATVIEVAYRVDGAAVRTVPSPDGRALGVLAPLSVADDLLVGFEVSGAPVRSITCPLLPADALLCGVQEGDVLRTDPQPAADALVLAQLDLDD